MSQLDSVRRINTQDFPKEQQQTIDKLSSILNDFMENVVNTVNGNIDFTNLRRELKQVTITVDAEGVPTVNSQLKVNIPFKIIGTNCINAINTTNFSNFVESQPFIQFTYNVENSTIILNNIKGLVPNNEYILFIELIAE